MSAQQEDDATEEALRKYKLEREHVEDKETDPAKAAESLQWLRDHGVEVESVEV